MTSTNQSEDRPQQGRALVAAALLDASLLWRTVGYEFRKRIQFRTGFFVREVLNGVVQPLIMLFVYAALFRSAGEGESGDEAVMRLGGWSFPELVKYVAGLLIVMKLIFDNRGLELSMEIFEGRITKYLTMPFRYFVLIQGRFVQFTMLQVFVAGIVWSVGYGIMGDRWLVPVSGTAAAQALCLVLMGSYACFLLYVTIHTLAFWLDVIWSLLVMAFFVIMFTGGGSIPVSQMPDGLAAVFSYGFPYWTISAPIEILMGRLGTDAFLRGLALVSVQLVALDVLRRYTWRRGIAQYVGAGM